MPNFSLSTPVSDWPDLCSLCAGLAGCAEDDPRLAYGQTQYLGGVYGNAQRSLRARR